MKSEGLADAAADAGISPTIRCCRGISAPATCPRGGDLVLGRQLLMANDDVRISFAAADSASGLYRNSTGR